MTTYSALIRAAAAQVLALRHNPTQDAANALIGRLYGIADGLERGDPAESIAGDPAHFIAGDPRELKAGDPTQFIAGDPADFSHIAIPEVVAVLQAGPDGEWTDRHTSAALRTFGAHEADQANPDVPDRTAAAEALHDAYMPDTGPRDRAKAWAALYRFWMDRDPPTAPVDPAVLPYRATFQGQAWIMDHTAPVDESRHVFYVSQAEVDECFDRENGVYDELTDAACAPPEVKGWQGPFDIRCDPRPFKITDDRPGVAPRYADDVWAVQALLMERLKDAHGDLDAEVQTQIEDLPDSVEDAPLDAEWVFEGADFHLTVSQQGDEPA